MFTMDDFTPELQARMEPFTDQWIEERLTCGPADRPRVEDGIRRCYELSGVAWHGNVLWVQSPLDGARLAPALAVLCGTPDQLGEQPYFTDTEKADLFADPDWEQRVRHLIDDGLQDGHREQIDAQIRSDWSKYMSPWWAWDARNHFCITVLGVCQDKKPHVEALNDANAACLWWPYESFCVVSDRPSFIHGEQVAPAGWGSHQLHHETGPALGWPTWNLWVWHGVGVPQWVVEDPTPDKILAEQNTEIRRCAIESYGWDRYLEHIDATPISEADDPGNPGHRLRLYALSAEHQPYEEDVWLLVMENASRDRDGTRRTFAETVPTDLEANGTELAIAAAAWQFDVPVDTYLDMARAT